MFHVPWHTVSTTHTRHITCTHADPLTSRWNFSDAAAVAHLCRRLAELGLTPSLSPCTPLWLVLMWGPGIVARVSRNGTSLEGVRVCHLWKATKGFWTSCCDGAVRLSWGIHRRFNLKSHALICGTHPSINTVLHARVQGRTNVHHLLLTPLKRIIERIIATFVHWLDSPRYVITTSHAATSCSSLILSSLWGVNKGGVDTGLQLVVTKLLLHTFNVN